MAFSRSRYVALVGVLGCAWPVWRLKPLVHPVRVEPPVYCVLLRDHSQGEQLVAKACDHCVCAIDFAHWYIHHRQYFLDITTSSRKTLHLVPDWWFDLLQEFLYQVLGFCQVGIATRQDVLITWESSSEERSTPSSRCGGLTFRGKGIYKENIYVDYN